MRLPPPAAHFLARHRQAPWNRAVAKACRTYLNAFDNLDYDAATNGELALLDRLACASGSTLLDVGANVGVWTAAVRDRYPACSVRSFEIDPEVAQRLAARFQDDPQVIVEAQGLSAAPGTAVVRRHARSSTATSIIDAPDMNADAATLEVELRTGDEYLTATGVEQVAFLKVDTEGNDLNVLRGFGDALTDGRIDALQFEHNEWAVPAHVHLRDFYDLLEPAGFAVGRLFPDRVLFRPWRPAYEREAAGNHLAVRRDLDALRARLAGPAA